MKSHSKIVEAFRRFCWKVCFNYDDHSKFNLLKRFGDIRIYKLESCINLSSCIEFFEFWNFVFKMLMLVYIKHIFLYFVELPIVFMTVKTRHGIKLIKFPVKFFRTKHFRLFCRTIWNWSASFDTCTFIMCQNFTIGLRSGLWQTWNTN